MGWKTDLNLSTKLLDHIVCYSEESQVPFTGL